jgi:hypothetical protein
LFLRRLCGRLLIQGELEEARIEALMENLALAVMQARGLAADSSVYDMLAETAAYALDLAEMGLLAESDTFGLLEPPRAN